MDPRPTPGSWRRPVPQIAAGDRVRLGAHDGVVMIVTAPRRVVVRWDDGDMFAVNPEHLERVA